MSGYLVDTNVVSERTRDRPEARVVAFLDDAPREQIFISVISIGEICKGIEQLVPSKRRNGLQDWLDDYVRWWFDGRILPVSEMVAERWGRLAVLAKRPGPVLTVEDGLIAATALEHGLTVVTRNVKDFEGLGVEILNPWEI
jgi:predicted nucleic acid-binding protein